VEFQKTLDCTTMDCIMLVSGMVPAQD